jgi:flavin reductase (DIM6/NTAB) family NADH-FMN oxidoreductase RutF
VKGSGSAFTQRQLRDAFGEFATGVTVVTAVRPDGEPVGITANSFTSVSLDPPLLLWCLSSASSGVVAFTPGAAFAVHVLSHEQRDLAVHFARRGAEKFEVDHNWRAQPRPPYLDGALCRFECRVQAVHAGGDHLVIVGEVLELQRAHGKPLAFYAGHFGTYSMDRGLPKIDVWDGANDGWF